MRRGKDVLLGNMRWVWTGEVGDMLNIKLSGGPGGDKVLMDHEHEDEGESEGECCGEVRGERPNQVGGLFEEVGSRDQEE